MSRASHAAHLRAASRRQIGVAGYRSVRRGLAVTIHNSTTDTGWRVSGGDGAQFTADVEMLAHGLGCAACRPVWEYAERAWVTSDSEFDAAYERSKTPAARSTLLPFDRPYRPLRVVAGEMRWQVTAASPAAAAAYISASRADKWLGSHTRSTWDHRAPVVLTATQWNDAWHREVDDAVNAFVGMPDVRRLEDAMYHGQAAPDDPPLPVQLETVGARLVADERPAIDRFLVHVALFAGRIGIDDTTMSGWWNLPVAEIAELRATSITQTVQWWNSEYVWDQREILRNWPEDIDAREADEAATITALGLNSPQPEPTTIEVI